MNDEQIEQAEDLAGVSTESDLRMFARGRPVADLVEERILTGGLGEASLALMDAHRSWALRNAPWQLRDEDA